ncbi:hypothetical protein ABT150_40630 [Streptomyces mirabilis]
MGTATASYRYPVKSMLGEAVIAVAVTSAGMTGTVCTPWSTSRAQ